MKKILALMLLTAFTLCSCQKDRTVILIVGAQVFLITYFVCDL